MATTTVRRALRACIPCQQLCTHAAAVPGVADLCDTHVGDARTLQQRAPLTAGVQAMGFSPPLAFRDYGGRTSFSGRIATVSCSESNPNVRKLLSAPSHGQVLVVDGGGSTRAALLGDMIAELAVENGWAGIIIHGACRDTAALKHMALGVKALGSHPCKSHKEAPGEANVPVTFGGVTFEPGAWLAADEDGIIVSPVELSVARPS